MATGEVGAEGIRWVSAPACRCACPCPRPGRKVASRYRMVLKQLGVSPSLSSSRVIGSPTILFGCSVFCQVKGLQGRGRRAELDSIDQFADRSSV